MPIIWRALSIGGLVTFGVAMILRVDPHLKPMLVAFVALALFGGIALQSWWSLAVIPLACPLGFWVLAGWVILVGNAERPLDELDEQLRFMGLTMLLALQAAALGTALGKAFFRGPAWRTTRETPADITDNERPPGWRYNPSGGRARLPAVGLALIGLAISTYLALYQLGVLSDLWDPFFGHGSEQVLTSLDRLPNRLPVPDTLFLVSGYLLIALLGTAGGPERWRTHPWTAALMGWTAYLLALVHLLIVLLEPIVFGAWCTLCLASAAISFIILGLVTSEFLAAVCHVQRSATGVDTAWRAFWGTGRPAGAEPGGDG